MSLQLQFDRGITDKTNLKLQLGCGANLLPGWVNTDIQPHPSADYLDFLRPLPFAANIFAAVFCEHTIEHIDKPGAVGMIAEVFRILRPGGLFRVVTPSLENFSRIALDPGGETTIKYLEFFRRYSGNPQATVSDAVNAIFYEHGHRHIYAEAELRDMLLNAGFAHVAIMPAGKYSDPIFNGVDGHSRVIGEEMNAIEGMALEATKS